jgi:hypothetical protein
MEELRRITEKYSETYLKESLSSFAEINKFALTFYKDVAEIYDAITRIKNIERNPRGFLLDDAPILGLLVRVWKLLREIIKYYEQDNAEIISILERPLIEASVIATYLMTNDLNTIEDYRKCSYKDRLRILREQENESPFFETKARKRLLKSIREKMAFEKLTPKDFDMQKRTAGESAGSLFMIFFQKLNTQIFIRPPME